MDDTASRRRKLGMQGKRGVKVPYWGKLDVVINAKVIKKVDAEVQHTGGSRFCHGDALWAMSLGHKQGCGQFAGQCRWPPSAIPHDMAKLNHMPLQQCSQWSNRLGSRDDDGRKKKKRQI